MNEVLEVVNENNEVVGMEERSVIHKKLLRHRAMSLFLVNDGGEILLCRRSKEKEESPNKWSFPVSGHKKPGESPEEAMRREVEEEMGMRFDFEFQTVLPAEKKSGNHFVHLFLAKTKKPIGEFSLDKKESSRLVVWKKEYLEKKMEGKEKFSPVFLQAFRWLERNGKI
jgi:isopentenyldiphosphate isomerase